MEISIGFAIISGMLGTRY